MLGPFPAYLLWIYFVLYFLFEVSMMEMVTLGIGEWLILSLLEGTVYNMLERFGLEKYVLENMIMLLIACGLWIFYAAIGKKFDARTFKLSVKMWCLLDGIMLILTAMMTFFNYVIVQELPNSRTMAMGRALSAIGGTVIVVLLFVMIYYYNTTHDFRIQKELAEIQNEQQRQYFLQLLEKEEETRKFRHDVINDLVEMQSFCENQNYEQMKAYLESTLGSIQGISKSSYDVGNDIVNTVLNYYLSPLKGKYRIEVTGYMAEKLSMEQRDLCILFSNLIKNAAEAVSKMETGKIGVSMEDGRDYLRVQVENTCDGKVDFDKNGIPKTSKRDKRNHGIGIHSIRQIVKKYEGTYQAEVSGENYQVAVCIKK